MILVSRDIAPEHQVYYLGAVLSRIIGDCQSHVSVQELYDRFAAETGAGSEMFALALDWLFLLGVVDADMWGAQHVS